MAERAEITINEHKAGMTWNGFVMTFTAHPAGTLTKVELITKTDYKLSSAVATEITIDDAVNWIVTFERQIIDWSPGIYEFEIDYTYTVGAETIKKSYHYGNWSIING